MLPLLLGAAIGIISIVLINLLTRTHRVIYYGLVLSGIGFLYVGFTWTDTYQLVTTIIQAFAFVLLAFYGIKRSIYILAAGYLLHGLWDLVYNLVTTVQLVPPHYDIFCFTIDFVMGAYLFIYRKRLVEPV